MSKLHTQLQAAMEPKQIFRAPTWGNPRVMSEALRDVRRAFGGGDSAAPAANLLQASLRRFVTTQRVANFTELKCVCYGVTVPVGESTWRLIDREPLFNSLLSLIEQRSGHSKQYRRCYQGLLNSYFGFDRQTASAAGQANWVHLRTYLSEKLTPIVQATARGGLTLEWLQALDGHRNLLTEDPCSRYADDLRKGETGKLQTLCGALGIASTSWVWDEALMAYVRAVCAGADDRQFKREMEGVLKLASGRAELKLAALLCTRATALTIGRYARCTDKPEHLDLRDTCLTRIGNPWVERTAWDAHVQDEQARQMVEGWIKRRLIKDFFELLAHDGGADLRRLEYWLKWEPQITDMWFVLGSDARHNPSKPFEELRQRMAGRRRSLDDPNGQNNAFVMRIGPLLVIEFGVTGNACYAFAAADFKGDLDKPLLSIHVLKQKSAATRLSHMSSWESRFDYELKRLLQSVPSSKRELPAPRIPPQPPSSAAVWSPTALRAPVAPSQARPPVPAPPTSSAASPPSIESQSTARAIADWAALEAMGAVDFQKIKDGCERYGIEWEDNRAKGGAFWVLMSDRMRNPVFAKSLDVYGFKYGAGKGFWIKDKA
jgi:hypothetical protein